MRNSSPLAQRRRLAQELRRLRSGHGISLEEVARELECDSSWLSRVERAERGIRPKDVKSLLDLYRVTDSAQREELLELSRRAGTRDWWHRFRKGLKPKFEVYLGLEAEASTIRSYQTQVVPGILQTPDYAQAVIAATDVDGVVDTEQTIKVRQTRQEMLTKEGRSVQLFVVLDEAVLLRQVGSERTMRGQLRHLLEMARLPNVVVQVLPFAAGAHAAMAGAFDLLEFPESAELGVAYVEQATSGLVLQSEREVRRYTLMWGNIAGRALSPQDSADLIESLSCTQTS
ncbi:transcriptional regulator [Sphaerisporangium melleum]|uniref:Transcriptional regulator n=1 Tax=Sphaerisporangium melleum TaxID=321316 RepID=A0A917R2Y9_9ACTN|nr:helix-turn-helix transcriptional regulator [Sphaerisporangium melleum]GGK85619.1 transcriptional regulator [Sphaerisporangium melleum]GII71405.1 transcriptional regulator [Sphaerisporangium melleum]